MNVCPISLWFDNECCSNGMKQATVKMERNPLQMSHLQEWYNGELLLSVLDALRKCWHRQCHRYVIYRNKKMQTITKKWSERRT